MYASGATEGMTLPISVVVPVYNRERLLREALESVAAQTRPPAEIIVVDDGSTDGSAEVAVPLATRVLRQANGGSAAARNAGLRAATQPWIAFMDSDDLWEPTKLEEQWSLHDACPDAGLILCDFRQTDLESGDIMVSSFLKLPTIRFSAIRRTQLGEYWSWVPEISGDFWEAGNFLAPPVVLARRDVLVAAGLFDPELRLAQDVEFFLRVLAITGFAVVEKTLVDVRRHVGNTSGDALALTTAYVRIAEKIDAHPERYPPGAQEAFVSRLFAKKRAIGRLLLEANQRREARAMLRESLAHRITARAVILWAATWVPHRMFHLMIKARRTVRALSGLGEQ